jgi:hypothetical protein
MNKVLISIKPEFTNLIETKEKNYEFRNYLISNLDEMIIYESISSKIKYIMKVGKPICYPDKILENGIGNKEFNEGKKYKYAYPIISLKKLDIPISLTEMKSKYNASVPQKYVYMNKYPLLESALENKKYKIIY